MRILHVGGGTASLPPRYDGHAEGDPQVVLLDIDPGVNPDFCMDARDIGDRAGDLGQFDVVYTSHFLEHLYEHEVPKVLAGFLTVLKAGGKLDLVVPNLMHAIRTMLERKLEPTDTYYRSPSGPVAFHDVLFGWSKAMRAGNLYYAHKCGFSPTTLGEALGEAGFVNIQLADADYNIMALAFKG